MKSSSNTLSPAEREAFLKSVENVQKATAQHLSAHRNGSFPIAYIANLQRGIDQVVKTVIGRGVNIACKVGCSYCCSARVEASAPEIFRIAQEISSRPAEDVDGFIELLRSRDKDTRDMAEWSAREKCPFLKNGLCSIYEIRPSACRKAHSLNVNDCEAGADEIPQSLDVVLAAEALMKGAADGYRQAGFDASHHELVHAVLIAVTDPTAESRWLDGEPVFESSRDSTLQTPG